MRASPGYSRPDPLTPSYLIHAPDWLKKHIVQRLSSSLTTDDVKSLGGSHYKVKSESKGDAWHTLSLGSEDSHPRCTCHDWQQHKLPCKHMCALFRLIDGVSWDSLPVTYRGNPLFTLDAVVLGHEAASYPSQAEPCYDACEEEEQGYEDEEKEVAKTQASSLGELPGRRRARRTLLIRKCVAELKEITDMVYNLKDTGYLNDLLLDLVTVRQQTFLQIPSEGALHVNETPKKKGAYVGVAKNKLPEHDTDKAKAGNNLKRQLSDPDMHVASLPKRKYGKPKSNKKFGNKEHLIDGDGRVWTHCSGVLLKEEDKKSIESGEWLTDTILNASQNLVAEEFPLLYGLRDTVLLANGLYDTPVAGEGMQVHHLGNHWVLSSSIGGKIMVYDSLSTNMSSGLRHQIIEVYRPYAAGLYGAIDVTLACVQQQRGSNDCGLYTIANMFSLALGTDPSTVHFHQADMRQHLVECLERQEVNMFPHSLCAGRRCFPIRIIPVSKFCTWHRIVHGHLVECTQCHMRYHFQCLKWENQDVLAMLNDAYKCKKCK